VSFRQAAIAALAIGAFIVAPAASAEKPLKVPLLIEPLTLTGVCDFPVQGEPIGPQNQKVIVFGDGRTIINGQLTIRVWNASNPAKAWEGATSGPVFLFPQADGSLIVKGTGVNLSYFFADNLGPGKPGALFLVKGSRPSDSTRTATSCRARSRTTGISKISATDSRRSRRPSGGDCPPDGQQLRRYMVRPL
jgi:hypothetical protein